MNNLRLFNEEIYDRCLKLDNIQELSSPLLVSSKRYLNNVKKHPIMYIGQETYEWVNYDKDISEIDVDYIEDSYDNFLINRKTSKTLFWSFIKNCLGEDYDAISKNIIWCNTLLMGKRYDKGAPFNSFKFKNITLDYLLFLYEYFEPSLVIDVSGNQYPYADITKKFLNKINSNIQVNPSIKYPVIIDSNVVWSYHPNKLSYIKMLKPVENRLNSKIKELN